LYLFLGKKQKPWKSNDLVVLQKLRTLRFMITFPNLRFQGRGAAHAHARARASNECARVSHHSCALDTVDLITINYPEMYLDVNRVAFKKHTDLLLFLVLSVK